MKIKGIGRGIGRRIDEIVKTGNLTEIESPSPRLISISELMKIHGVGEKTAQKLVDQYQITALDRNTDIPTGILSKNTMAVLKADIKPLSRSRAKEIFNTIENHIKSRYPYFEIYRCGSYRRGKKIVSDLDILMVHPGINDLYLGENFLLEIVLSAHFLTDHLCGPDRTRYMGIGYLDGQSFRIDIRMLPYQSLPFGLLYFTGSSNLNKLLRIDAKRQGYTLNEYGLYQNDIPIELHSEREIFDFIGFEYLKPKERNI
jgi:DNA polymerase lambda